MANCRSSQRNRLISGLVGRRRAAPIAGAGLRVKKNARVEPGDAVPAAERERAIDLTPEEVEDPKDSVFARAGDAP